MCAILTMRVQGTFRSTPPVTGRPLPTILFDSTRKCGPVCEPRQAGARFSKCLLRSSGSSDGFAPTCSTRRRHTRPRKRDLGLSVSESIASTSRERMADQRAGSTIARQSGWQVVLPQIGMSLSAAPLPSVMGLPPSSTDSCASAATKPEPDKTVPAPAARERDVDARSGAGFWS